MGSARRKPIPRKHPAEEAEAEEEEEKRKAETYV